MTSRHETDHSAGGQEPLRSFVFDVASTPAHTNAEMLAGAPDAEHYLELLGRDLLTRTLVQTDRLCVYHETALPGERVKPHRHGTYQVDFVLRGELRLATRRSLPVWATSPPMLSTRGGRDPRVRSG